MRSKPPTTGVLMALALLIWTSSFAVIGVAATDTVAAHIAAAKIAAGHDWTNLFGTLCATPAPVSPAQAHLAGIGPSWHMGRR